MKERILGLFAITAIAAIVLVVSSTGRDASADAPHTDLDFHIGIDTNGDGDDDCSSSASFPSCTLTNGVSVAVSLYVDNTGDVQYAAFEGVLLRDSPDLDFFGEVIHTWPDCGEPGDLTENGSTISFGCHTVPWSQTSRYTGRLAAAVFVCSNFNPAVLALAPGAAGTRLIDQQGEAHATGTSDDEGLTIGCSTPTSPAQPPCQNIPGDVTNDHLVNAIDGMFLLQYVAGIRLSLPCPANATFMGQTGSVAAQLILQSVAGLI
jgi:hypothetical protein